MAKRMIPGTGQAATLLDPPKPPTMRWPQAIAVPVGRTGVTIHVSSDGGGVIVYRRADRSRTVAFGLTAAQLETLAYDLSAAVGATR